MSSPNPPAPVLIPPPSSTPRPLPPIPHYLAAINAVGNSFAAAYPNHPLATFAKEEVQMEVDERALLLYQKEELREKMLVLYLDKLMLGTERARKVVKDRNWLKEQELSVVREYKTICTKLGQRPEVGYWFF
ncbi:hypothetical protein EAE96_009561 [Botrytis aclada]|nr:hypothetical protein EAE96_009561 [Botrytis aclada]